MEYEMKRTDAAAMDGACWLGVPAVRDGSCGTRLRVETAYFKNQFFLSEQPACTVTLSAHSRYKLFVNGRFVTYGPCKGDQYRRYCDRVEIGSYLQKGENSLLLQVVSYPPYEAGDKVQKGPDWSVNRASGPCILLSGSLETVEGTVRLTTGHSGWQVYSSPELTPRFDGQSSEWLGYLEQVEQAWHISPSEAADREGINWEVPQRLWEVEESAYGILPVFELYQRPIPLPLLKQRRFVRQVPARKNTEGFSALDETGRLCVPPHTAAVLELDAGELTTGFFRLPMEGGAGAEVNVLYSEAYGTKNKQGRYTKTIRDDFQNGELEGYFDTVIPSGERTVFEPFWFRTFRFVRLTMCTGAFPLMLSAPSYLETGYPLEEKTKLSAVSLPWMSWLWEVSLRTLRRCMHETYEDCPYYEQMQYTLDTRLQMLFTYAVSGDRRMPLRTLYDYHASLLPCGMLQSRYPCEVRQVIPPFALHWIAMLRDYYWESGDKAAVRRYLPTMLEVLGYFHRHKKNGLVERLGYWEFVDWSPEWSDTHGVPHACEKGPSTILNFLYGYALRLAAELTGAIGLADLAGEYTAEAETLCSLLHARCFDAEKGLYREGPEVEEYSQHAQVWAVLAEAGTPEFRKGLMERVAESGGLISCTFPLQFYLFRAYEAVGLYGHTEKLWELWKSLLPLHLTTIPETPDDSRSDCHAWGAILLYEFPRKILGVEAETPGYGTIAVRPIAEYVPSASGTVHTPKGDIEVRYTWNKENFHLEVAHSCAAEVIAYLPGGGKAVCPPSERSVFSQRLY